MRYNLTASTAISCILLSFSAPVFAAPDNTSGAEMDLRTAVQAALAHTSGHVLEAEREREDGKLIYEVDIVHDSKITEVEIDAATGKVIEDEKDDLENRVKAFLTSRKKIDALKAAKLSLSDAIAKAEEETKAKALEAEFEREDGQYVYEIELQAGGESMEVMVDAETGTLQHKKH